jgi:hypothetical protein
MDLPTEKIWVKWMSYPILAKVNPEVIFAWEAAFCTQRRLPMPHKTLRFEHPFLPHSPAV